MRSKSRYGRSDRAGPIFLAALLAAALVPSVLTEIDATSLFRLIETALAALAKPDPCFQAVSQTQFDPRANPAILCGTHVSDSPMLLLGAVPKQPSHFTGFSFGDMPARCDRTLFRSASPRAPPVLLV